jgi:hypothetical protein
VVLVFSRERGLSWWAPLRRGESAGEVARRLIFSGGRVIDIVAEQNPVRLVMRDGGAPSASLVEAQERVAREIAADPGLMDSGRAYRQIPLLPHIDRSFYELKGSAVQPAVGPIRADYRGGRWTVTIMSTYAKQTADIVLDEDYDVVDVRRLR